VTTLFPSSYCQRTRFRLFSLTMEMHKGKRRRQAKKKPQAQCRRKVRLLDAPDDKGLSSKIRTQSPSHRRLELNGRKLISLFTKCGQWQPAWYLISVRFVSILSAHYPTHIRRTAGLQTVKLYHIHSRGFINTEGRQHLPKRRGWFSFLVTTEMSWWMLVILIMYRHRQKCMLQKL